MNCRLGCGRTATYNYGARLCDECHKLFTVVIAALHERCGWDGRPIFTEFPVRLVLKRLRTHRGTVDSAIRLGATGDAILCLLHWNHQEMRRVRVR